MNATKPGWVTTVITSYNKGPYLNDAIDSALIQDYPHQEVIVVDDGSTDDTKQVVESYGDRVQYIYQENSGCPAAKNTGIFAGSGEYVAILDGDDRWIQGKLSKQVALLEESPDIGLVYTDRVRFMDDKKLAPSNWVKHSPKRGWVLDDLLQDNFIPVSTILARRECLLDVGCFNAEQRIASDYDLWLRFARKYQVDFIDEVLMEYRMGIDSIGSRVKSKFTYVMEIQNRFVDDYYDGRYPQPAVIRKATANRLAAHGDHLLSQNRNTAAMTTYMSAWTKDPLNPRHAKRVLRSMVPNGLAQTIKSGLGLSR